MSLYFLYNTAMQTAQKAFLNLIKFRSAMNLTLSRDDIKYIWGRRFLRNWETSKEKELSREIKKIRENENEYVARKIEIVKEQVSKLKVFDWVQFIGISGSVAAGFAKEDDDIDVFIVVKNGTVWLYRVIIILRNLFHNKIRAKRHKNVKNKLCLNLICEERGVQFPNDIFNFHELIFLKPLYNGKYKNYIFSQNAWLEREYFVKKELLRTRVVSQKDAFLVIKIANHLAFIAQLVFMSISRHNPEIGRLKENFKKGKIEFFDQDFREDKLTKFFKN